MRQLALLLVCVAFANAASVQPTQGGYFAAGREYVYQYEGQVLTGLPGVSKEVSGIKIVAETRIQMKDFNKCLFRLEQVRLHKMQAQTENPAEQQTEEKLQRLQPEVETRLIEQLVKPIEFTYVDGKISNIVTSQDELVWSSNIKKGVMELMLVNIRGTDDLNQPESQRTQATSILRQKEHYRVMERGIAGFCESVYNVKVSRSIPNIIEKEVQPSRYVLNITKTRDLLECQRRTQRSKVSILDGKKCERCNETEEELPQEVPELVNNPNEQTEKKVDMLKCLSKVRYNISLKDHSRFLIDSVIAEGQHIFMPFGPKGGKAITFVNQTFILKSNREIPEDQVIPEVQTPKQQPEDLRFVFQEWETHQHDAEEDQELTTEDGTHLTRIRTTVKQHLQKIYDNILEDRITEDAPKQFILLVKTLKKFSPLELNNIFDRLGKKISSDTEVEKEKKQILLDAIIQVESEKSIEILLGQIEMRTLEGEEASQILSAIGLTNNPTERTVDRVMALCKGYVVSGTNADKQLRKTCWLAFGSLMRKACKINKVCSEQKIQEYSMNLLAGIKPTKTNEERRMCLKAIGNAGLVLKRTTESETDSIDKIAEIAKSSVINADLRTQAIYSLRRVAKDEAKRVIPLCMPMIKDQTEDHEVRIACFVIVMDAQPEEGVVLSIVSDIKNDKSRQVASFIYTHFESLLENRPPCNKKLVKLAKKALLELRPVIKGAQYSKRFLWSPTFYEQKVGLKTEASIVGTPTSPFPVSGAVKLGATILNRKMNVMEVGFHAKCLRDIAEKILGVARPVRKTQEMLRMTNGRLPEEHEKSVTDRDLEKLDQELPTTEVHSDQTMVKASGYLKLFGNELRTFTVDKPTVWSYLEGTSTTMAEREEKMRLGENPYSLRKIFSLGRGVHEIPTEVGLPLHLWIDSAAILAFDVSGKAVATPRLTDVLRNKDTKLQTVDVEGTIKPRAAVSVMGKMQVSLDNVLTGLYINGALNTSTVLKGQVNVNVTKRLYKTKFDTPSSEHQAISLRSRPYTFTYIKPEDKNTEEVIDTTPEVVRQSQNNFVKKLIKGRLMSPKPVTNTWSIGKENLGVEVELKTRRVPRSCSIRYGPTHVLFNGPLDVNVTVRRGVNAPREVIAQMQLENELKTQEQYQEFKEHFLHKQHFLTTSSSSSSSSEEHQHDAHGKDIPAPPSHTSFKTQPLNLLKRFEEWKYDSARWPFTREEVETVSHDHTEHIEEVTPDNTKKVELYHIYFNISTNGSQPIRELISRISLDQQNEFYKAVRLDVMTAEKRFRENEIHRDQIEENTEQIRTLCLQGELEHPAYAMTLLEPELLSFPGLPDVPRDPKVLFKLNTQWGKSCHNDQKMQLKARVERSDKQVKDLQEETPYKQECRRNIEEGNKYTEACKTLRKEREELRAVHAELTHNELVKTQYKSFFYKGLDMIKRTLWDKVETERAEVHNPDKTVLLTGELEEASSKMNVSIKHVRGNVKFNKVWIPQIVQDLKVLQPYKLQQHMVMSYSQEGLNGRNINQCKSLKNDTIITFDKVLVNYEQSMCDHILAKDCSSKERFVILTRKLAQTNTKKVVTVYLDNTKIQFLPRLADEEIQILINNTDINLPVLKKLVIKEDGWQKVPVEKPTIHIMDLEVPVEETVEEPHHSSRERKMKVWDMPESSSSEEVEMTAEEEQHWEDFKTHVKKDIASDQPIPHKPKTLVQIIRTKLQNSIMLFAPDQELKVFYDGYNVKVELPQKYKDMQCGLCGDFNGEVSNELVGPNREIYKNDRQFGRSFQHTTAECAQDTQCAPAMEFAFDTEINLPGNSKQFACITKSPVPHCLPRCQPIQEEKVNVEFVCFEHEGTSDPFATKSRSEIIKKYKAKKADYKRTMMMHTKCVREE